ncbi:MAG: hypothetical protein INR68_03290 [Methylobacterium mesophilicum]|nr:hypothetical protein [Methylobacterium mesophilicum]
MMRKRVWRASAALLAAGVLAGCATTTPAPASSKTVNRFYRDMAQCFAQARPDAVRKSTFTPYVPKATTNVIRETVTFTVVPKTGGEYRVVFAEGPPETTVVSTYAVGRLASPAQVQNETGALIDGCADRPF